MSKSLNHRIGSRKYRNGKSACEKNRWRFHVGGSLKICRGKRGSDKNNPEIPVTMISDIWPRHQDD